MVYYVHKVESGSGKLLVSFHGLSAAKARRKAELLQQVHTEAARIMAAYPNFLLDPAQMKGLQAEHNRVILPLLDEHHGIEGNQSRYYIPLYPEGIKMLPGQVLHRLPDGAKRSD